MRCFLAVIVLSLTIFPVVCLDWNSLGGTAFSGEAHFVEKLVLRGGLLERSLVIHEKSDVRIAVATDFVEILVSPYEPVQQVYAMTQKSAQQPSGNQFVEQLEPGTHSVFFFGSQIDEFSVEVAIVPTQRQIERQQMLLPCDTILPKPPSTAPFNYQPINTFTVPVNSNSLPWTHEITLGSSSDYWHVRAVIGTDFLSSAHLNVGIRNKNNDANTIFGRWGTIKGHVLLETNLPAGQYIVTIVSDGITHSDAICSDYSFSLSVETVSAAEQALSLLQCTALPLPASLDNPGFSMSGRIAIRQTFLVNAQNNEEQRMSFTVKEESFFRISFTHSLRVISAVLADGNGNIIAENTPSAKGEYVGIFSKLNANAKAYTLTLHYGISTATAAELTCENVLFEIAVEPTKNYNNHCTTFAQTTKPDLSALSDPLLVNNWISLSEDTFCFKVNGDIQSEQIVVSQTLNAEQEIFVSLSLGTNFIYGGLDFALYSKANSEDSQRPILQSVHRRNRRELRGVISKGSYEFRIFTAHTQKTLTQTELGLSCFLYSLSGDILPHSDAIILTYTECEKRDFPLTLLTPEFFTTTDDVRFAETFAVPSLGTKSFLTRTTEISVAKDSFLSVYVSPNEVDIDLVLLQDGVIAAMSAAVGKEETLHFKVTPGYTYSLRISYYDWSFGKSLPTCPTFHMEFSVLPLSEQPSDICTEKLPTKDFGTLPTTPFSSYNVYTYKRTLTPFEHSISFELNEMPNKNRYQFKTIIGFANAHSSLESRLHIVNADGSRNVIAQGKGASSRDVLGNVLLNSGKYVLVIYEPGKTKPFIDAGVSSCVEFSLTLAVSDETQSQSQTLRCPYLTFPATLNNAGLLSPISNGINLATDFRLTSGLSENENLITKKTEFSVTTSSLLHVYAPKNELGVLFSLKRSDTIIVENVSSFQQVIESDDYSLIVSFPSLTLTSDQLDTSCVHFPLAISIRPIEWYYQTLSSETNCELSYPPNSLMIDGEHTMSLKRPFKSNSEYTHTIQLSLSKQMRVFVALSYEFCSSGLAISLTGNALIDNRSFSINLSGSLGPNSIFVDEDLPEGTYQIQLSQPSFSPDLPSLPQLTCAPYTFTYSISDIVFDETHCSDVQTLPTNVYDQSGNSGDYGGIQDDVGSVLFSGNAFLFRQLGLSKSISFKAVSDCVVTVSLRMLQSSSTASLALTRKREYTQTLYETYSSDSSTVSWRVTPKTANEVFEVLVTPHRLNDLCTYYALAFSVTPFDTFRSLTECTHSGDTLPKQIILPEASYPSTFIETSKALIESSTDSEFYESQIKLSITELTKVTLTLQFGFRANALTMFLTGTQTATVLSQSDIRMDGNDIVNKIVVLLDTGDYLITIRDRKGGLRESFGDYCSRFTFSAIGETQVKPIITPSIQSISPIMLTDYEPCKDIIVRVRLNVAVQIESGKESEFFATNAVFVLFEDNVSENPIFPSISTLSNDNTNIELTFDHMNLDVSRKYFLKVNSELLFAEESGLPFEYDEIYIITYSTIIWDCSEHGAIVIPFSSSICVGCECELEYSGDRCEKCADGYHRNLHICVPNEQCGANGRTEYCSGNGECIDNEGMIECECDVGYSDDSSGHHCSQCANGYIGYPKCEVDKSIINAVDCHTLPLITTLDSPAYLGINGIVHIYAEYGIIPNVNENVTFFTLHRNSILRIVTTPIMIDIDVYIERIDNTGIVLEIIAKGTHFGTEESLFVELNGSENDLGLYRIRFVFYPSNVIVECPTFVLQLAIAPTTQLSESTNSLVGGCGQGNPTSSGTPIEVSDALKFDDQQYFAAFANHDASQTYVWRQVFDVKSIEEKTARIRVKLASRFLQGHMRLVLAKGDQKSPCLPQVGQSESSDCIGGIMGYNVDTLDRFIDTGFYTLFIVERNPQKSALAQCALYEFAYSFSFVNNVLVNTACEGKSLPSSLNEGFMVDFDGNGQNHLHIVDDFLLSNTVTLLSVTVRSAFRISSIGTKNIFVISTEKEVDAIPLFESSESLYAVLDKGNYWLTIVPSFSSSTCPKSHFEIALEPVSSLPPYFNDCASSNFAPNIQIDSLPFVFDSIDTFNFNFDGDNSVVSTYDFVLTERVSFYASVSSSFLFYGTYLMIEKKTTSGKIILANGKDEYNQNSISLTLEHGIYTISIRHRRDSKQTVFSPLCLLYNFHLHILPIDRDENTNIANVGFTSEYSRCFLSASQLPTSFSTERFLRGSANTNPGFDFFSPNTLIPFMGKEMYVVRDIHFSVQKQSLLRVFVAPNDSLKSVMTIDVSVFDAISGKAVVSFESGAFSDTTSAVTVLSGGEYTLTLVFWRAGVIIDSNCNSFAFSVSIGVVNTLQQCNAPSNSYPPAVPSYLNIPTQPYSFDSTNPPISLHIQQAQGEQRKFETTFILHDKADLVSQIHFSFYKGDFTLSLKHTNGNTVIESFECKRSHSGCYLQTFGLTPGLYVLSLTEVFRANDARIPLFCVDYTFSLTINPHYAHRNGAESLPSTLSDKLEFLSLSQAVHISNKYSMFNSEQTQVENMRFDLSSFSLFQISAAYFDTESINIDPIVLTLKSLDGSTISSRVSSMSEWVNPGSYIISLEGPQTQSTMIVLELSIVPQAELEKGDTGDCTDLLPSASEISVDTDGFGFFSSTSLRVSHDTLMNVNYEVAAYLLKLEKHTHFVISLGFDFVYSELTIRLDKTNGERIALPLLTKNVRAFSLSLPKGDYNLRIVMPNTPITDANTIALHRCTSFALSFSAIPSDANEYSCDVWNLPKNLNNENDVSLTHFGGPISSNGHLSYYGDSFFASSSSTVDGYDLEFIEFSVNTNALFSVFTRSQVRPILSHELITGKHTKATESHENIDDGTLISQFVLQTASLGPSYTLQLQYKQQQSSSLCKKMAMAIHLSPVSVFENEFHCGPDYETLSFSQSLKPNNDNVIVFSKSGFFSREQVSAMEQGKDVELSFSMNSPSFIYANFAFNSLASFFDLSLEYQIDDMRFVTLRSSMSPDGNIGDTTLSQILKSSVSSLINYRVIIRSGHQSALTQTLTSQCCTPFSFSLQVVPVSISDFVTSVSPANGVRVSPLKPLLLTITTSSAIKIDVGNSDNILSGISMVPSSNQCENKSTKPITASDISMSNDPLSFQVTFPGSFVGSCTYTLSIDKTKIVTENNKGIILYQQHTFAFHDSKCSGHGTMSVSTGECVCTEAYAGKVCDVCALGYQKKDDGGNGFVCSEAPTECKEDTCGCEKYSDGKCVPLGKCSVSISGYVLCECREGVISEYCTDCADGYHSFPKCSRCLHDGVYENNQCVCTKNFGGSYCESCAQGYKGDNCEFSSDSLSTTGIIVIVVIAALLLITLLIGGVIAWRKYARNRTTYQRLLAVVDDTMFAEQTTLDASMNQVKTNSSGTGGSIIADTEESS